MPLRFQRSNATRQARAEPPLCARRQNRSVRAEVPVLEARFCYAATETASPVATDINSPFSLEKKFSAPLLKPLISKPNRSVSRPGGSARAPAKAGVISMLLHGGCGYANF